MQDCLWLSPIQPFYTKKEIDGGHYRLLHDVTGVTSKEGKLQEQHYAVFCFNALGQLTAADPASSDLLYLVYLYCARYEFEKAYAVINQYVPKGRREELTYIHWLCDKLPAQLEKENASQSAITTSMLLAIQLKALLILKRFNNQATFMQGEPTKDLADFLARLPDYIIDRYKKYHRLHDHLSADQQLAKEDRESIAQYVWLLLEDKKCKAIELLSEMIEQKKEAEQSSFGMRYLLSRIDQAIKELNKVITECTEKEVQGPLMLIRAKTARLSIEEEKSVPFIAEETIKFDKQNIVPYWNAYNVYKPTGKTRDYRIEQTGDEKAITADTLHLTCPYDNAVQYTLIDSFGKPQTNTIFSIAIENITLKTGAIIPEAELAKIKAVVINKAIERGEITDSLGTLHDLAELQNMPSRDAYYQTACQKLVLNIPDDILFSELKYYFSLSLDRNPLHYDKRLKLKDFCKRTIVTYADLNEALTTHALEMLDNRKQGRLQIAIVLLRSLYHRKFFAQSYNEAISKWNHYPAQLKKCSLWEMINDKEKGFY